MTADVAHSSKELAVRAKRTGVRFDSGARKCFFTLSDADDSYYELAQVLTLSVLETANLELFCVFDGEANWLTVWLEAKGVTVLHWTVSFYEDLVSRYDGPMGLEFCKGTYLCSDLPAALQHYGIPDRYVLYVDTDVLFTGVVDLERERPTLVAAPPDWAIGDRARFSTGVMVMNIPNLLGIRAEFLRHLQRNNYNFAAAGMGPCDQGAWNTFLGANYDALDPKYDWKPWWGVGADARIVHFAGPKPADVDRYLLGQEEKNAQRRALHRFVVGKDPEAYRVYVDRWKAYRSQAAGSQNTGESRA